MIGNNGFVPVTDHLDGRADFLNTLRFCLGMATGDNDTGTRVVPDEFTDSLSGLHPGFGSDGTGVDDAHIAGFCYFGPCHALFFKACCNTIGFILVDLASQGFDIKGLH